MIGRMPTLAEALDVALESPEAHEFRDRLASWKTRRRAPIHSFHRWYGKLIPAIPAAAIEAFTQPGELVADPFCGSGTTLVEARRAGRASVGVDINPLATLLTRVKTRTLERAEIEAAARRVENRFARDGAGDWRARAPDVRNLDHYWPEPVARDLVRLLAAARAEEAVGTREFFVALASAINRDVSNADTRHVFWGVSRRMREKIADGWCGDVPRRFARALRDRVAAAEEMAAVATGAPEPRVATASAEDLPSPTGAAALVVTNPPYVSSIRYVETFKWEAFWAGTCHGREDLHALDRRSLGTERVARRDAPTEEELAAMTSPAGRDAVEALVAADQPRMARVVWRYASGLDRALATAARCLRHGGHAVVKVSASRLRTVTVATPLMVIETFARHGVDLRAAVEDDYDPRSRSLTTARNWYSGRLDADHVLVLRRTS